MVVLGATLLIEGHIVLTATGGRNRVVIRAPPLPQAVNFFIIPMDASNK